MIKTNKFEPDKPNPKHPLKSRVKIINETYRNGEVGYITKIKEIATPNEFVRYIYYVQFRDKTIASFSEENIGDEHCVGYLPKLGSYQSRNLVKYTAESVKKIGAVSTVFTEADVTTFDFYYESIKSELIKLESINLSPTQHQAPNHHQSEK